MDPYKAMWQDLKENIENGTIARSKKSLQEAIKRIEERHILENSLDVRQR